MRCFALTIYGWMWVCRGQNMRQIHVHTFQGGLWFTKGTLTAGVRGNSFMNCIFPCRMYGSYTLFYKWDPWSGEQRKVLITPRLVSMGVPWKWMWSNSMVHLWHKVLCTTRWTTVMGKLWCKAGKVVHAWYSIATWKPWFCWWRISSSTSQCGLQHNLLPVCVGILCGFFRKGNNGLNWSHMLLKLKLVWKEITASPALYQLWVRLQSHCFFNRIIGHLLNYLNFWITAPPQFHLLQCHFGPEDDGGERWSPLL